MPSDLKLEPQVYEPGEPTGGAAGGGSGKGVGEGEGAKGFVNSQDATLGNNINQTQILNLPLNGRANNTSNFMALQPGVAGNSPVGMYRTSVSDAITQPDSGVQAEADRRRGG